MTFADNITTTLGTALENWHTNITSVTGFDTLDSSFTGDTHRFFSATTPHDDSAFLVRIDASGDRLYFMTGKEADYSYDSATDPHPTFNPNFAYHGVNYPGAFSYSTNVRYWNQYDGDGWVIACRREAGDGNDGVAVYSYEALQKIVPYTHNDFSAYTDGSGNPAPIPNNAAMLADHDSNPVSDAFAAPANSLVHYDPEGSGYNYWESVFRPASNQYGGTRPAVGIGRKVLINEVSDSQVSNQDTITDANDNPVYKILKYPTSELHTGSLAIRAD